MDASLEDHKLCGFLLAVLSASSPDNPNILHTLGPGALCDLCEVFSDRSESGFKCENGVVLSPINSSSRHESASDGVGLGCNTDRCGIAEGGTAAADIKARSEDGSPPNLSKTGGSAERECEEGVMTASRTRMRTMGMVDGSISVVSQLHALVTQKCLKIVSRVIDVETDPRADWRTVILVDVYLPVGIWSGWQFPRLRSTAAALFKHLSCEWGLRSLILAGEKYWKEADGKSEGVWNLSDCHVLGCKLECGVSDPSKRRLFELHEIFKSLPSIKNKGSPYSSRVMLLNDSSRSGIWVLSDDILLDILNRLGPVDLVRFAATCHHLRSLAAFVMPCMKLKLFPHQLAAVEWMLRRERNAEVLPHPLYVKFSTEDGLCFYLNAVSGDIVAGSAPTVRDFHGGMFCDEPGLGKTVTALSLILKTQGTMAQPPADARLIWCTHNGNKRCALYEHIDDRFMPKSMSSGRRVMTQSARRFQLSLDAFAPEEESNSSSLKRPRLMDPSGRIAESGNNFLDNGFETPPITYSGPEARCTRSLIRVRKNLLHEYGGLSNLFEGADIKESSKQARSRNLGHASKKRQNGISYRRKRKATTNCNMQAENWVQCDACYKWRKISDGSVVDVAAVWFCSMSSDPVHQSCKDPEETWDNQQPIKHLQGFHTKGTPGGMDENVSFFTSVLREYKSSINSVTRKALTWLARLSSEKLFEMETIGLISPVLGSFVGPKVHDFQKIFQAFGLIKRVVKGVTRWYYPRSLDGLAFDLPALRLALCEPLDTVRMYLSKATLIVVPANLVDHWKMQIQRHVVPGQLRVFIWNDHKKPPAHSLAWDYDVVITTFSRLSAEWGPHKNSPLMQVHWLRIMLDEGHTLCSSLSLTNKLQMAISLTASNRWLLTGTPTPNTPNSQILHLQPLLKFLHEEAYGENMKAWEAGIVRPLEAEMEEGRSRLSQLLRRCMICSRKTDLHTIPPCINKVTYLDFTEEHAKSYNELVETVRRNILMADWNDPSHIESLLNPKQWKFRSTTTRNVRLSCCVAGHIKVSAAGEDIQETMDQLIGRDLDPNSEEYDLIKYNLLFGGNCFCCKGWCRLPIITPCKHLLCLACVALDSERCTLPGCGNLYEMQTPETLARPENPNPKWPVPKDLIELQPSYKQDEWNPDWQSTSSSKVSYLVHRLKILQETNFSPDHADGANSLVASKISKPNVCLQRPSLGPDNESYMKFPGKVLIFSQFLEHIHVIEQQLMIAGIKFAGMYSPMHLANKMKSLAKFQHDASCVALLMDGSAALGLDLSFVTHVFLMEPIWDRSMEEQVISRAHRMGATRPVHVETLVMRGTIEEQMLEFLQNADYRRRLLREELGKSDREARSCRTLHDFAERSYLARLNFVQTNPTRL